MGGTHYKREGGGCEHWDFAWDNDLDYFQGQITKYVTRWKDKNGYEDLEKAKHFLDKYMELVSAHLQKYEDTPEESLLNVFKPEFFGPGAKS